MSRGRRNCNPGNIRLSPSGVSYVGEVIPSRDRAFRTFRSMKWGYRAIFVLLHTYYLRYGLNVVLISACPIKICNDFGFIPLLAILVANVWRHTWGVTLGSSSL